MNPLNISIEHLMLNGFDAHDTRRLLAALRATLAASTGDVSVDRIRLQLKRPMQLRHGAQPEEIGRTLARALLGGELS